jgi:hypothetical protein
MSSRRSPRPPRTALHRKSGKEFDQRRDATTATAGGGALADSTLVTVSGPPGPAGHGHARHASCRLETTGTAHRRYLMHAVVLVLPHSPMGTGNDRRWFRMSESVTTFAERLSHFALSVDIVTDDTFDRVRDLVVDNMRNELEAAYFGLMEFTEVNGEPGLRTIWSSAGIESSTTIVDDEGVYKQQVCLAFDKGLSLWVVEKGAGALGPDAEYVDMWSACDVLPPYWPPVRGKPMKTSIMVPLERGRTKLGVMYLESTAYVEATDIARREMEQLAAAVAILMELRSVNRLQVEGTKRAVGQLSKFVGDAKFPRLTRPNLFVASSSNADDDVMEIIREVLSDYRSKVNVIDWTKIEESGAITVQIANKIVRSRFGICYFSEATDENGAFAYADNPNVIFEAGMLHALINSPDAPPSGWIPVREKDSPPAPFDFANERIEPVPRDARAKLDEDEFRRRIRRRVEDLLQTA